MKKKLNKCRKIYICHTYYHVLVTLTKEVDRENDVSIVLANTIPQCEDLFHSLSKSKLFKNIYLFDEVKYQKEGYKPSRLGKFGGLFTNYRFKKMIKPNFELKKTSYTDYYIYNDATYLGYYLRANKIYYNLLEDAKDSYKVLDNYIKIDYFKSFKHIILGFAYETLFYHGKSKYSKIVEVNDAKGIKIPQDKIKVSNKREMFDRLKEEQKLEIYNLFINNKEIPMKNENAILILTQPLFNDLMVKTIEMQRIVYQEIIENYCKGFEIVIKPHPRDTFNYEEYFIGVRVMNKNIPTEILNFNPNIRFKKAITVSSSSVDSIDFVEEKIYLGFDWLKKYDK